MIQKLIIWAKSLKHNLFALYLAYHRNDVSILAKVIAISVVTYALSPIDFIPDFIPIIGYLDDLILLPLGIILAIRLIPKNIWDECKIKAQQSTLKSLPKSRLAAIIIISIWIIVGFIIYNYLQN